MDKDRYEDLMMEDKREYLSNAHQIDSERYDIFVDVNPLWYE